MFTSIREVLPQISPWMECCYQTPSLLHLGGSHILSCSGVQQGDPLGPLGFALALHPILIKIRNRLPSLTINSWYLDDGTLCGSPGDLRTALDIIEEEGPSYGLTLNRSKSLLVIPCDDSSVDDPSFTNPLPAEIPTTRGGFTLLGSPIGDSQFCNETVLQRVLKVKPALDLLPELENAQMSLSLLRSCLSPKIAFSLRTSPASSIPEAISRFDSLLYDSLSNTVGSFLSPWSWDKATLPVSLGGVGLRHASHYASASYIGSVYQSSSIVESILGSSPLGPPHWVLISLPPFQTCLHCVEGLTGLPSRMWTVPPNNVFSPTPSTPTALNPSCLPHQIIDPGPSSCPPPYPMLVLGCRRFPPPHLVSYSLISSFGSVSSIGWGFLCIPRTQHVWYALLQVTSLATIKCHVEVMETGSIVMMP